VPTPTASPFAGGAGTTGQGGTTPGGSNPAGGNPAGGGLDVPYRGLAATSVSLDTAGIDGFGSFAWAIPGALLGAPLALILLVVLAQAIAGMILIPVTRRVLRRDDAMAMRTTRGAGSVG